MRISVSYLSFKREVIFAFLLPAPVLLEGFGSFLASAFGASTFFSTFGSDFASALGSAFGASSTFTSAFFVERGLCSPFGDNLVEKKEN